MRVLFVTGGFATDSSQPWLLDDLATALVRAGHQVDVLVASPTVPRPAGVQSPQSLQSQARVANLTVNSVGIQRRRRGPLGKLVGYATVGLRLHTHGYRWTRRKRYDLCVFTSPACFTWGFPRRIRSAGIAAHTVLLLWDFFPIHQLEIGRVTARWLAPVMKALERAAINGADTVALMSPANVDFFRDYHRGFNRPLAIIPPWSAVRSLAREPLAEPPLRVVFGGQIAKGRGIDTLLDVAELLVSDNIRFIIAGDGPERRKLQHQTRQRGLCNVEFLGSLARDEYRKIAATAHLGIAITVAGVSPPSFPSKIIEYCGLSVPVLVCVEDSSDAGDIVVAAGAGFSALAGDAQGIAMQLRCAAMELESGKLHSKAIAAKALFDSKFSVDHAVAAMLEIAGSCAAR